MESTGKLSPVIEIDNEKCINCYACITACPVKYCLDGSGEKLGINHDYCIGCGHCIPACNHGARRLIDDTPRFFADLKKGDKMVAIVAPAVVSVFGKDYLKLNGYLSTLGIEAVFDVSLGAELTVYSYIEHIKTQKPKLVIAQPCPAIVTYIELYHPELLPYLSPADSPMLHSIKLIREYYPEYRHHKIAVISPCIAKKREFEETGHGDYNVTMLALKNYLHQESIELSSYPAKEYVGVPAERAVTFSAPGGLLDTAERFVPGIRRNTRKIEGTTTIYHYLTGVSRSLENPNIQIPLLIDCLNCELGCNGGPGTGNSKKDLDEIESAVRKRSAEVEKKLNPKQEAKLYKKYHALLGKYWKPGLYHRTYVDRSADNLVKEPNEAELKEVFKAMKKYGEADMYDCTACGYGACKSMARAIFNNVNKPQNCAHYNLHLLEEEKKTVVFINQQLKEHIGRSLELIEVLNNLVSKLNTSINTQSDSVNDCSTVTERIVNSLKDTSELSRQKRESVVGLTESAGKGQDAMKETINAVQSISDSVDGIGSAIKIISVIAANTNLLSMNAAIEAAHAGDAGKGFAVVADEIRRLSENTRQNSSNISQTLSDIISRITTTTKRTGEAGTLIDDISTEINGFGNTMTELIDTLSRLSSESSGITTSLESLREHSAMVKSDYDEMLSLTDKLRYDINFLAAMSADIVKGVEKNDKEIAERMLST